MYLSWAEVRRGVRMSIFCLSLTNFTIHFHPLSPSPSSSSPQIYQYMDNRTKNDTNPKIPLSPKPIVPFFRLFTRLLRMHSHFHNFNTNTLFTLRHFQISHIFTFSYFCILTISQRYQRQCFRSSKN